MIGSTVVEFVVTPHSLVALTNTSRNASEGAPQLGENVSGLSTIESTAPSVLHPMTVSAIESAITLRISSSSRLQSPSTSINRRLSLASPLLGAVVEVKSILGPTASFMMIVTSTIVLSLPHTSVTVTSTRAVRLPSASHTGINASDSSSKSPSTVTIRSAAAVQLSGSSAAAVRIPAT